MSIYFWFLEYTPWELDLENYIKINISVIRKLAANSLMEWSRVFPGRKDNRL